MASVNTPLTTLISADKDLIDHVKSLPKSRFFYLMYYRVLLTYFLAVNLFVALLLKMVVMPDLGILFFTRSHDSSSSGSFFALTY